MNRSNCLCGLCCLSFLMLAGCQPLWGSLSGRTATSTPVLTETPTSSPAPATQTPVILIPSPLPTEPLPPSQTPIPTLAAPTLALQVFFPTARPTTSAELRPPLYPTPWAIGPYDHFYFARPIAANYPSEPIGDYRYGGTIFAPGAIHTGVDIPAPRYTPVLAAGPGMVVWAGVGLFNGSQYALNDPYGNAVVIRHDFGYLGQPLYTVYAHMSEIKVVVGQWLNVGEELGTVGSTGNADGPHLHFEVRLGTNDFYSTRNPELWLAPPQGWGVLVGRLMNSQKVPLATFPVYVRSVETNQPWTVWTYADSIVNSDAYYHENMVLSDLPAGAYEINIPYAGYTNKVVLQILPGQVTYFTFQGFLGFNFDLPAAPALDLTETPTP
ncbi:MAG: peptidoglycan DD-metalloendopeptidase family protein [Anaerolineales bacterium]|jgi:murein DD-endopeptidase MepM/ murein hydrolase activator NlpD